MTSKAVASSTEQALLGAGLRWDARRGELLGVAIYGGGRVQRYSPDGMLLQELFVPAEQSTSCAFAGPELNRLNDTTATEGWSDEQRRAECTAGLISRFDTDARGRPAARFRSDATWWATVAL